MNSLPEAVSDVNYLLALPTEELAVLVLHYARRQMQNQMLHMGNYVSSLFTPNNLGHKYDEARRAEIELAVSEAWSWLEIKGLLLPATGMHGPAGWRVLSRMARNLKTDDDVRKYAKSRRIRRRDRLVGLHAQRVRCRGSSSNESSRDSG
jgi:hypothetical protein